MHDHEAMLEIFCPDCRGRFSFPSEDFLEGDVLECPLCGAEISVLQESPPKVKLFSEDDDF